MMKSRLGDQELVDVTGEIKFLLDHERRWTMNLEIEAAAFVMAGDEEPVSPRIGLDLILDVTDWRALEGRTLALEGDTGNGWIQLFDFEAVWDVKLTFGHAEGDRIHVALEARACEHWDGNAFLPLSIDAMLTLGGDAAPRGSQAMPRVQERELRRRSDLPHLRDGHVVARVTQ